MMFAMRASDHITPCYETVLCRYCYPIAHTHIVVPIDSDGNWMVLPEDYQYFCHSCGRKHD